MKKSRALVGVSVLLITGLLVVFILGMSSANFLSIGTVTANAALGPEGVSAGLYGIQANDGLELEGKTYVCPTNQGTLSVVGTVNPNAWISYGTDSVNGLKSDGNKLGYKWVRPDPKTPVISIGTGASAPAGGLILSMSIDPCAFSDLDKHGNPSGSSSPETIEWYSYNVESNGNITWNHYEAYVVTADFYIDLSVQQMSQYSWGAFLSTDLWLKLNTNVWSDAFTQQQMLNAIQQQKDFPNSTLSSANYRGAFPIWAWAGQWNPFIIADQTGKILTSNIPPEMSSSGANSYLQVAPSWGGQEVSIYTQPSYVSSSVSPLPDISTGGLNSNLGSKVGNPGDRSATSYYIPITLVKYGAAHTYSGGAFGVGGTDTWYYPSSSLWVRLLYVVWGQWIYLWTSQEAANQGYQKQNESSSIVIQQGIFSDIASMFSGLGAWLANPINQYIAIFIVIMLLGLAAVILIPGLGSALGSVAKKSTKSES